MADSEPRESTPPSLLIPADLQRFAKEASITTEKAPEVIRSFYDFYSGLDPRGTPFTYATGQYRGYSGMFYNNFIIDLLQNADNENRTEKPIDPFAQIPQDALFRLRLANKRGTEPAPTPTLSIHVRGLIEREGAEALDDVVTFYENKIPQVSQIDIDLKKENVGPRITAALELVKPLINQRLDSGIQER